MPPPILLKGLREKIQQPEASNHAETELVGLNNSLGLQFLLFFFFFSWVGETFFFSADLFQGSIV